MKISARNQFKGTITGIEVGAVNAVVSIKIAPKLIVSAIITKNAVEELGLKKGGSAYAIIKASNVMVGIDD